MRKHLKWSWLFLFLFLFTAGFYILSFAGWEKESKWKYFDENGVEVRDQWIEGEKGERYYIDEDGWMVTGWHQETDGEQYFFDSDGAAATGLVEIDGRFYYFRKDGRVFFGDQEMEGQTYHFVPEGVLIQGKKLPPYKRYTKEGKRVKERQEIIGDGHHYFQYVFLTSLIVSGFFLMARIRKHSGGGGRKMASNGPFFCQCACC